MKKYIRYGALTGLLNLIFVFQASANISNSKTLVHLFEWTWTDIAKECEKFLGPKGFYGVQISPPQEHIVINKRPWFERYQVVSYQIDSRGGNRAQFSDMVQRCNQAGVKIFVDAVINHTTGLDQFQGRDYDIGFAGTRFEPYNYPGIYSINDFNRCGRNGLNDPIHNFQDRWEVQNCNLVTLTDLKTSSEYVRSRVAEYLNDLLSLGVSGFRIDAAKHIPSEDLHAIVKKLNYPADIFQEVIDHGHEPISVYEYIDNGQVTEFRYGQEISRVFKEGKLDWLKQFGQSWGFVPDEHAVVFIDNHDTQRSHGGLTFRDGYLYALANTFMLAWPYGTPKVMSSYKFNEFADGPPLQNNGDVSPIYGDNGKFQCFDQWVCEHRWIAVTSMVQFRNIAGNAPVTHWWSNGDNQIAFAREGKGFVVINNEYKELNTVLQTDLPSGLYCNIATGSLTEDYCPDHVYVSKKGRVYVEMEPLSSLAIHIGEKLF